jgi:hypothetical protein
MIRRLVAEFLGTAWLIATVVGSGIMAQQLSGGNIALALLANTAATVGALYVLITVFGPISGAHFNPAVSLVMALRRELTPVAALAYGLVQMAGAVAGTWVAHAMFALPILQVSTHLRDGPAQWFSEFVASFGLVATILGTSRARPEAVPLAVALYIGSAYWFTASTSFANPAAAVGRALTDSFAGIAPSSVGPYILAELAGALVAWQVMNLILRPDRPHGSADPR